MIHSVPLTKDFVNEHWLNVLDFFLNRTTAVSVSCVIKNKIEAFLYTLLNGFYRQVQY